MKIAGLVVAFFSIGAFATSVPIRQYHITDLEWQVEVSPGHTITVNGTIQSVAEHLSKHNPNWQIKPATAAMGTATIVKRATDFGGGGYFCGAHWPYAPLASFWEGLRYLRSIRGQAHMGPGPGVCSWVSCSYGTAVYLCNDGTEDLTLDSFERIADGVSYIIGWCTTSVSGTPQVAEQLFHPDNWNVIVRQDSCWSFHNGGSNCGSGFSIFE